MSGISPIRAFREDAKLTLEQLGDQFGVHKATILRWEQGDLPAERVLEIEKITGIPRGKLRPDLWHEPKAARS